MKRKRFFSKWIRDILLIWTKCLFYKLKHQEKSRILLHLNLLSSQETKNQILKMNIKQTSNCVKSSIIFQNVSHRKFPATLMILESWSANMTWYLNISSFKGPSNRSSYTKKLNLWIIFVPVENHAFFDKILHHPYRSYKQSNRGPNSFMSMISSTRWPLAPQMLTR